jgi:HD-like signal output (HDOD) protein
MIDQEQETNGLLTNLRQRIESTTELPAMPDVANELLRLTSNPDGNINDLIEIIELDPSLSAQLLRYANSAFFGHSGDVVTLQQAITGVLGYRVTIDIALGIALGKSFNIPSSGPMGLFTFWQHSVYSAALAERLLPMIPRPQRPTAGLAFLCGLLHNFGILLIGHLFFKETAILAQVRKANPTRSVVELERTVLTADHTEIGTLLMRQWNLPAELQTVAAHHHDPDYQGVHSPYVQLTLLTDRALKSYGIGEAESDEIPDPILDALGLSRDDVEKATAAIIDSENDLNQLARQLAV